MPWLHLCPLNCPAVGNLPLLSPGSLLLESLKDHISTTAQDHCKAIYLHVLTTNNTAINFYENRDFKQHHYLPYYYSIRGVLKDGFTYVLYINGGHPPWTILYPLLLEGNRRRLCCGFLARGLEEPESHWNCGHLWMTVTGLAHSLVP